MQSIFAMTAPNWLNSSQQKRTYTDRTRLFNEIDMQKHFEFVIYILVFNNNLQNEHKISLYF